MDTYLKCCTKTRTNVAEGGQTLAEFFDFGLVCLDLLAFGILGRSFFLCMEAEILEQDTGMFCAQLLYSIHGEMYVALTPVYRLQR